MLVTIVAKTRMGSGACIGAINSEGRSVRLIASDAAYNDHFNLDYNVGEIWEIQSSEAEIVPPHTENIIVRQKVRLGLAEDLPDLIERYMPPRFGGVDGLYNGLVQSAGPGGALFIAERSGVPTFSTMFWQPDQPLVRDTSGKRIRYRYPTGDGGRTLTFVGFQEPPAILPAGTTLRVSLAHWWRPEEHPEAELRCYVQLSGWLIPGESRGEADRWEDEFEGDASAESEPEKTLDEARDILNRVFGYDSFRPFQAHIIHNVLTRRDSLAVMPTGSGKSMCFQLPALLFSGLTVVVSPLISLMEDQVMQLRQLGISAAYLNSTLSYDGYVAITQQIKTGHIKILYASPETLLRPETLVMLNERRVDCLTIDEAHCISEWGHDFRPDYRQLVQVRHRLPHAVCLAITATATARVRRDIKDSLAIRDADEFVSSFDRENLLLSVSFRDNGLDQILSFLENHRDQPGIIYCNTRDRADWLAAQLVHNGWNALPYHAGLDYATRRENQRRFNHDESAIIVATIAFGMGINKSNVRFVIHHDLPKDLENYYQQIGRAGRDGLPADCLLLFSRQDVLTINFLADQADPAQRAAAAARLQSMIAFAETNGCRRRPLLTYFGETYIPKTCGRCDNCLAGDRDQIDLTTPAQKFLSCVARTREIFGATYIIDVLRGSHRKEIADRGHTRLSTYNIGGEYTKKEWQQLARQFITDGLLSQDMDHGSLKLTPKGRAVLKGETYMGAPPAPDQIVARRVMSLDYDVELFERLRRVRMQLAQEADVPPFVVFSDAALSEMATYYPQSRESFSRIPGVGAVKLDRYGNAFLRVVGEYCREKGLSEKSRTDASETRQGRVSASRQPRREQVTEMFLQGESVAEIAEMLGIQWNSVMFYLWQSVLEGTKLDKDLLLSQSKLTNAEREIVFRAFSDVGIARLKPIYEALQQRVAYEELHMLRLCYALQNPSALPIEDSILREVQQAILRLVESFPGKLPRSGVAKLLIGSKSDRIAQYTCYPEYGRFSTLPRNLVMAEVDKLIAENRIWLDDNRYLIKRPGGLRHDAGRRL